MGVETLIYYLHCGEIHTSAAVQLDCWLAVCEKFWCYSALKTAIPAGGSGINFAKAASLNVTLQPNNSQSPQSIASSLYSCHVWQFSTHVANETIELLQLFPFYSNYTGQHIQLRTWDSVGAKFCCPHTPATSALRLRKDAKVLLNVITYTVPHLYIVHGPFSINCNKWPK